MVMDPKCRASQCVQHIVGRLEKSDFKESAGFAGLIRRFFGRA
jgi:flagellar biosynthesis protein FlhG